MGEREIALFLGTKTSMHGTRACACYCYVSRPSVALINHRTDAPVQDRRLNRVQYSSTGQDWTCNGRTTQQSPSCDGTDGPRVVVAASPSHRWYGSNAAKARSSGRSTVGDRDLLCSGAAGGGRPQTWCLPCPPSRSTRAPNKRALGARRFSLRPNANRITATVHTRA